MLVCVWVLYSLSLSVARSLARSRKRARALSSLSLSLSLSLPPSLPPTKKKNYSLSLSLARTWRSLCCMYSLDRRLWSSSSQIFSCFASSFSCIACVYWWERESERASERARERARERGLIKEFKDFWFALESLHKFSHFLFLLYERARALLPPCKCLELFFVKKSKFPQNLNKETKINFKKIYCFTPCLKTCFCKKCYYIIS